MGARDSVPSTSRGWRRLVQVRGRLGLKVTPALAVLLLIALTMSLTPTL